MVMLLLEKNCDDYKKCYYVQRVLIRKEVNPKYTKVDSNSERLCSWNIKSIRIFNALVLTAKRRWNKDESKEMEIQLKSRYARIYGETGRRGGNMGSD